MESTEEEEEEEEDKCKGGDNDKGKDNDNCANSSTDVIIHQLKDIIEQWQDKGEESEDNEQANDEDEDKYHRCHAMQARIHRCHTFGTSLETIDANVMQAFKEGMMLSV